MGRAGTAKTHGAALGAEEIEGTRKALGWTSPPFEIPEGVFNTWRSAGAKGATAHAAWQKRVTALAPEKRAEFERLMKRELPKGWEDTILAVKRKASADAPKVATRQSSQTVLEALTPVVPEMIGGSADLTGSNNTKTANLKPISASDFAGRYIHYGIREHGMAAAMNGMALHGGVIPYGGTFFVFSDYCRPAVRLAALMGIRTIFVMTHDSIGVGEDGPTHQPVEQLAAMRAMPRLLVMRPADGVETAECWQIAIENAARPSLLALSRQDTVLARRSHTDENLSAKGAYVLIEDAAAQVTFLTTGTEMTIALKAREMLAAEGIGARVVSMPCWDLFEEQPKSYRDQVIGTLPRVAIEAAAPLGWDRYIGPHGAFVGMHSFGASGPAKDVYQHFNITPQAAVAAAKALLK